MKMKLKNIIIALIVFIMAVVIHTNVNAAGIGMKINKSSAYVGDTFSVTISGINGKVKISGNSNISLSTSGTQWVEGSMTITGTTKSVGTGIITVTPIDVSTSGANPEEVTSGNSKSITISEKPTQQSEPQKPTQTTTNNNKTTKKTENKKTEKPVVETKEKEEASSEFGIHLLKLIGVKENKEEVEIALDKAFNIKTFEYTCNIANDIKTVRIEKEAYEYNDLVQISGLEEELKVGENNVILKLAKDGKELSYHIKITKEEPKQEVMETNSIPEQTQQKETIMVSMPLIWFILLEIVIVALSVVTTIIIMNYLKKNSYQKEDKKQKKEKEEEKEFKKI